MTPQICSEFKDEGVAQSASSTEVVNPYISQVIQAPRMAVTAAAAANDDLTNVVTTEMANGQVFHQGRQIMDKSVSNIAYIPTQQMQTGGRGDIYLSAALPQMLQIAGNQTILIPGQTFVQNSGVQMQTTVQNGETMLLHGMIHSSPQFDGQNITIGQGNMVQTLQLPMPLQQTLPVQVPVSNPKGHITFSVSQLIQGIPGTNIFQSQEQPITVSVPANVVTQLASQNAQEEAESAITATTINGTPPQQQQQQFHQQQQQQQLAVGSFQLPNGQVGQGQINQIFTGADGTAVSLPILPITVQDPTGPRPANVMQMQGFSIVHLQGDKVQGCQAQQIIENAQLFQCLEPAPNVITANVVSAATNYQQHMSTLSPIQPVPGAQSINQQLQQVPIYPSKWPVAVNPATMSTPTQYPKETSSIETSTARKDTNTKKRYRKRKPCICSNCVNGSNSKRKKKQHICYIFGCNKVYAKTSHLQSHILSHTGEKPYECTWKSCEKKFSRSDELRRHYKTHTGDKKYCCQLCVKRFIRSDHLLKHTKTHFKKKNLNNGNKKMKL